MTCWKYTGKKFLRSAECVENHIKLFSTQYDGVIVGRQSREFIKGVKLDDWRKFL